MLADATTHVHSNSPPAMPCSNPRAPGPTNLRFNGITRPIYKRSRAVSFSAFTNLSASLAFGCSYKRSIRPAQHRILTFMDSAISASRDGIRRAPKDSYPWSTSNNCPAINNLNYFLHATSTPSSSERFLCHPAPWTELLGSHPRNCASHQDVFNFPRLSTGFSDEETITM